MAYTWAGEFHVCFFLVFVRIVLNVLLLRKNFERHFQESRHAFGMRALGLPNTKHFHEITKIEDALARMLYSTSRTFFVLLI